MIMEKKDDLELLRFYTNAMVALQHVELALRCFDRDLAHKTALLALEAAKKAVDTLDEEDKHNASLELAKAEKELAMVYGKIIADT